MYHADGRSHETARLEDYLRAIRLRKWVVLGLTIAGLIAALLLHRSQVANYQAVSRIALYPTPVGSSDGKLGLPNLEKEKEILASDDIASLVKERIGSAESAPAILSGLSVKFIPKSDVLVASYTADNPKVAAASVNAFADIYSKNRNDEAHGVYDDTVASAATQLADASKSETALRQQIATGDEANRALLQPDLGAVQSRIRQLTSDKASAEAKQVSLDRSPPASILAIAEPPTSSQGIPGSYFGIGGLLVGALAGVITAFVLERLDTTARDENDVALTLGTSVMGTVPLLGFRQRSRGAGLIMASSGGSNRVSAAREAFRRLRSSMQFLNVSADVGTIMVTSSSPGEGKSITSANLSVALAQNGSKVVLVSGDMRRPSLEQIFGIDPFALGLAEYLNNAAELNIMPMPSIDNLWIVPAGQSPGNPGELLSSDRFEQMIKELRANYVDYVIVDTPPVLSTADAVSAARHVDGVLVVVDTQRTETSDLLQVRADLDRSGSRVLGAVLNRQRFKRSGFFKRGKNAYYEAEATRAATAR